MKKVDNEKSGSFGKYTDAEVHSKSMNFEKILRDV